MCVGAGQTIVFYLTLVLGAVVAAVWLTLIVIGVRGWRRKSRPMMLLGAVTLALTLAGIGCGWYWFSPAQVFQREFGVPPPPGVRMLRTRSSLLEDSAVLMRFEADEATMKTLLGSSFTPAQPGDLILSEVKNPPPWWSMQFTESTHLYRKTTMSNGLPDYRTVLTNDATTTVFYHAQHPE